MASSWWVGLRLVLLIMAPTNTGMGIFSWLGLLTKFCFMTYSSSPEPSSRTKPNAPLFPFSFHWYKTPCCLHATERVTGSCIVCDSSRLIIGVERFCDSVLLTALSELSFFVEYRHDPVSLMQDRQAINNYALY